MQSIYLRPVLRTMGWLLVMGLSTTVWSNPPTTPPPITSPPPVMNAEGSVPVVISYGQAQQAHTSVNRGEMEPVGVPRGQSVTVTLLLPLAYAGQVVSLGLYDGGVIGTAAPPNTTISRLENTLSVSLEGKAQFNFQAGRTLGLYRLLVNVGASQYLLSFYAVDPSTAN